MSLKWERDKKSPYVCNYFAVLGVGPNSTRPVISQRKDDILRRLKAEKVCCACGHEVDLQQVSHATNQLLEARSLAEELLLIHPQPDERANRNKVKILEENLRKAAALPFNKVPVPLRHPSAVLWFTPTPGAEAIELPTWKDLGLVEAGDPEDLALDIVFDS